MDPLLWLFALAASGLALVFAIWRPRREVIERAGGLRGSFLRWGHSLVWMALAAWAALLALGISTHLALVAGVLYLLFLVTLLRAR